MEGSIENQQTTLNKLVQWFEAAEDSGRDARQESERCRDYYDGYQYTDAEIATLKKRKQPIITVNRIKPKVNTLKGLESQSRTNPKALPRNQGHDDDAANAAQDAIRFVLDDNDADTIFSDCFDNLIVEGCEAVEINVEPHGEDFDITLRQIHWDRQFFDQHSREKTFRDARYLGEVVWLDLDVAQAMYPDAADVFAVTLDKFGGKNGDTYQDKPLERWADDKRKRVCLISMAYQEAGQWMHAIFVRGGFVQEPQPIPFVDEDGNPESLYVYQSAYVDRDGNRYGPVKDWLPIQDEINKRRSKALHLMNVRQVKVRKGAVDSIAALRAEVAKPDGVVEENIADGVQLLQTGDMAAAQFQLLAEAKNEIDAVGVNAALAGTETRAMSGRALEARQNAGTAEVRPILDAHSHFKNRVYRAIWNRIRQYWTEEKWVRVTDNEKNVRFVGLNKPVTMMDVLRQRIEQSGEQVDPAELQALEADPQMSQVVGRANVPAEMDVDIILDEVPDFAALQSEQFATLSELARSGMPIPPEAIIRASSLRDKEQVIKEMQGGDIPPQVQQQMQAMQQALGELQQRLAQAEGDRGIDLEKLRIDAYKAETERMKALQPVASPAMSGTAANEAMAQGMATPDIAPAAEPQQIMPQIDLSPVFAALSQMQQQIEQMGQRGREFSFDYDEAGNVIGAREVMPAPQAIQ